MVSPANSSCGKTTLIKTIAGAIRPPLNVLAGIVRFHFKGRALSVYEASPAEIAQIRWRHLSYIMQGSMSVLNPVRRIKHSFTDFAFRHIGQPLPAFREIVEAHLARLHLQPQVLDAYPHELSGGMRQRVTIALATVCRPEFIIADEPTTALDVVVQKGVLALIREVQQEIGSSLLFVTHDLAVHANLTDRLGIMYAGRLVEEGRTADLFREPLAPLHPASDREPAPDRRRRAQAGAGRRAAEPCRAAARLPLPSTLPARDGGLPRAEPAAGAGQCRTPGRLLRGHPGDRSVSAPLLEIERVTKTYAMGGILSRRRFDAVDRVSFALEAGRSEIFTIIGESGSGKTTLARMMLNMVPPSAGAIRFEGIDLTTIRTRRERLAFMQKVQPIFQNPFEAFNPLKRIDRYLYMTARRFTDARTTAQFEARADRALGQVGLSLAEVRRRFPHELSGGQLQRVAVARALISGPSLIVADEPVSMVDASLRMAIVNLFKALRDDLEVSIVYITHDLATAYYISDRIIIMQKGKVVESGDARTVLSAPRHPYSILLKNSVLQPDPSGRSSLTTASIPLDEPLTLPTA